MEPPPDLAVGIDAHYIQNVAKLDDRLLIMLDLEAVISQEETQQLEPLQEAA